MTYTVFVDELEAGFENNVLYPANGTTEVHYKDETGAEDSYEVTVPEVEIPADEVLGDEEEPEIKDEVLGDEENPNTGDPMILWASMTALSAAGMMVLRKKEER